jgi:hypothetical protein
MIQVMIIGYNFKASICDKEKEVGELKTVSSSL